MRGAIFLMLEAFVVERRGYDAYEDLLDAVAGKLSTDEPFLGAGTYRAGDLLALVDAEAAATGASRPTLLRELGAFCFPGLAKRYAWALAGQRSLAMFAAYLRRAGKGRNGLEIVHAPPLLRVAYRSPAALCALGDGLIQGAAAYFATPLALVHVACVDRGDPRCVWEGALP